MVTSVTASNTSTNRTSAVKFWLSEEQAISPGHRELFLRRGNAANYEDYVTGLKLAIKQTVDSSRVARLSRKIKPIFILAHSIAPITTSASQLSPMPGSLILGGITCILSFATRVDDYQSRLVEMLEWMGDEIDLINQYRQDSLFDDNFEMEASENRIAADILKFCSRVAKMFYDADGKEKNGIIFALKAQCKDFDTKFGDLKTHFKLHVEDLKNHRDMAIARRLKAMGGGIESIESMLSQELDERRTVQKEKEKRRRRFLNIIPSISFEDIQENNFDRRVPGTGDWLLRHPDFRAWRDCPSSTLLWVRGKPGSGKSHLASRVIHELKSSDAEDEKSPTAYAYCTTTQSKTRMTFNNLLGSLLKQLYGYVPLAQGIESLLSKADVGVKDELQRTEMKEGIQLAASSLGSSFLIVDGLDECSHFPDKQFNELCSFLADLGTRQQAGVSIKVLILSRDDDPIIKSLSDATQIYLDKGANDGDIKSYISHRVDEINSEPSSDEQASFRGIKDLMFKHAGGIFLWVHFKANQFKEIGIVEDIMEALEDTTEGLDNLYGEEIQKVLGHSSKFVRERSLKSLLWVTNSYRPLTKPELLDALSTKPKRQQLNSCQRLSSHISLTAECFHLINEDGGYYRLRHASLKDFLLSELPILQAYATLQREAHSILSEVCLTYLNFETIKKTVATSPDELNDLRTNHPLLEYAAFFGPQHFKEARKTNARQLEGLMHQFLENEPAMRLCIQMLRSEDFERSFWSYGRPTPLHIMAIFNLRDIADAMSNSKDSLCCPDEFGIYPIEYSVFFSGEEMSIWLLNRYNELQLNHDTEYVSSMLNGCRLRLLHNSARRDWDDIVRSLISLGLRKDNRSAQHGRTPLHMAVLAGANRSLRCLLDLGASPDISAYNHETPLVMAARCRNSAAVHILLRCKVNVNHQGEHEETALHWAATQGLVEMASDLLDHGAKINARLSPQANFCGETPLHCAVRCGSIEMVQMLIDRGADINAQCSPQLPSRLIFLSIHC
ncbi:Ankyrin-1 [Colletotrichum fructicola]|nr:Ankyrin-1 [Colletotrichum fructicola]